MTAGLLLGLSMMLGGVDATVASADGTPIRYHAIGQGEPALVLVHCWTCDRHLWDAQLTRLASRRRVVSLDLAGHGESGKDRKAWTIEAFGDDVVAVADALELKRLVLVGHSMGGHVSLAAARKLGERVVGIVPVDTLLDFESRMAPAEIDAFAARLEGDYPSVAEAFVREYLFVPTSPKHVVEAVVARTRAAPSAMAIGALRSTWGYDAAAAADRIKAPIRAINGDKYPTNVAANRRHAPGYAASYITGIGHYPMLEAPERFLELLEATLRDLGAGARR